MVVAKLRYGFIFLLFTLNLSAAETKDRIADKEVTAAEVTIDTEHTAVNEPLFSHWTSEAELGFVQTTGNTETESLNFKFALDNKRKDWEHSLKLESSRNADSTGTTAERYLLLLKSQYTLTKLSYLFGRLQYEDDRFSGYNYQASEIIGYGRRLVKTDELKINAELGAGMRQNDFENGKTESEKLAVAAADLDWKISKSANLTEELSIEIGEDRTISKSVTGLKTKINSSLSSKVSYTVKHASEVPVGTKKTDTELAVTLVYTFK